MTAQGWNAAGIVGPSPRQKPTSRRVLGVSAASTLLCLLACRQRRSSGGEQAAARAGENGAAGIQIVGWWDLPQEDARSHDLSGIGWDPRRNVLYAISDKTPRLVEL